MDRCAVLKRYHLTIAQGYAINTIKSVSATTQIEERLAGVRPDSAMHASLNAIIRPIIEPDSSDQNAFFAEAKKSNIPFFAMEKDLDLLFHLSPGRKRIERVPSFQSQNSHVPDKVKNVNIGPILVFGQKVLQILLVEDFAFYRPYSGQDKRFNVVMLHSL